MKPFTELSLVRLRMEKTDDNGDLVAAKTTGTIVHVHETWPDDEPAYIVEIPKKPVSPGSLVTVRHGEIELLNAYSRAPATPVLSGLLFAGACLCGLASAFSIGYCADVVRMGSGWGALTFMYFIAPFLVLLPLVLIVLPSGILFKRRRNPLDLASLLLSLATVLVTIIELAVLISTEFHGC